MKHVDDETLAMLAVSGVVADDAVTEHLAACARCRDEVADLQRVAAVTRSSSHVRLDAPPEAVWDRIAAEVRDGPPRDLPAEPPAPVAVSGVGRPGGTTRPRGRVTPGGPRVHRRRRVLLTVAAVVGAFAIVLGIGVATGALPGLPGSASETVLARAELDALPGWSGAGGTAELERDRDGRLSLVVDLRGGTGRTGTGALREVWMMRSDLDGLVSVGFLDGDRGRFTVPSGMDTARFPVVDVSAEADDGDPAHSGDSIVRGRLARP